MNRRPPPSALFLLGATLLAATADAADTPPAIARTVERIFGAMPAKIEHEREGNRELWEVEARTSIEVELTADGAVGEVEVEVPVALVPVAVRNGALRVLGRSARIAGAEILVRGDRLLWEIEGRTARGEVELLLTAAGRVLEERVESEDDGDDDE